MEKKLPKHITPFSEGNEFYWPTDFDDSSYCLSRLHYAKNKNDLFPNEEFSGDLSEKLEIATKDWDFLTIIKSALYFHMNFLKSSRKGTNKSPFFWFDWPKLIYIFVNENTSKEEVLDVFEFFYEAPQKETLFGVYRALSPLGVFSILPVSPESLKNLLTFLKIDIVSQDFLVKEVFKTQSFKNLRDFLITMDCTVNTNLVLTQNLTFYFEALEKDTPLLKEIEKHVNKNMEFTRLELEDFNVYDIFESSEQFKSGISEIYAFYFTKDLLHSLIKNPSINSLKIFELFESYLYKTKQKTIFFIKISFEKGGDLYNLICDFCSACKKEIKLYCKTFSINSEFSLISFVFTLIAGSLALLLFFASNRSMASRLEKRNTFSQNQTAVVADKNFYEKEIKIEDLAFVEFVEEEFFSNQVKENQELNFNFLTMNESQETVDEQAARNRPSDFGSLITHYTKNQIQPSQYVSRPPVANVQVYNPVQNSQKIESYVRPTRSIPRGTTMSYGQTTREGLKGKSLMTCFRQTSIELQRVPFEVEIQTTDFLANDMSAFKAEFENNKPNTTININRLYRKVDELHLPTNQISILGSSLQYKHCTYLKQEANSFVKSHNLKLVGNQENIKLVNLGKLEGDHTKNVVQRQLLKLSPGESGVVFIGKDEHAVLGKERNYSMPDQIGYTPGTAGAMDLIDYIERDNDATIRLVFDQNGDAFFEKGYDQKQLRQAYMNASAIDRKIVQEKIANSGVDENMFLALNINNMYADGLAQDFDNFINLVDNNGIDCKKACDDLDRLTAAASTRRDHAFSVRENLRKDTPAWRNFNMHEERVKGSFERAHRYVSNMPGYSESYINKEEKEKFLGNAPDEIITLEQAFESNKAGDNLKSLKKHPQPLFGSRLYSKNQKLDKKNSPNQVWK